jgi:outer membrane lipoprotein-sorting protein
MKKHCIICILLIINGIIYSQQPRPVKTEVTDQSQAILKKLKQQWTGLQSAKISFTLQSDENGKSGGNMKGTLWTQGQSYKLEIPGQIVWCDGNCIWNYLPANGEVSINPYEEEGGEITLNPLKVMADYEKYYRSAFIRESAEKGIIVQTIDLYPKQVQSFYKIRLVIRKDKLTPLRAAIHEKNGRVDTYHFDKILMNPKIESGFFRFNAAEHPNVEIIDMR